MSFPRPAKDEILEQAQQLSGAERAAYLQRVTGEDESLRHQIEELIQADELAGDFLARPAADALGTFTLTTNMISDIMAGTEKPGDRIGRYKLREKIGEGGCGIVYVADQEEPVRRRVALKIIKLGMDTKQVVARFEAERQALALMDHVNIAKVLDAGATDTGRPYFVMELVRGIRITDYCDQNKLSTHERLNLFVQVCHAIQHAHQKGIIHRDIKPSNILVTLHDGVPVPKVIDFGIAKATTDQRLTDKTIYTAFEQFIGTPAYMSPEQAEMSGLDIDTRSDVYSLGVLLYELLTGRPPFDPATLLKAGLDKMRRIIREQEPQRPSTCLKTLQNADLTDTAVHRGAEPPRLIHLVRGDLDWIVMKTLEKDRTRRYETVTGLAADIKRHLGNEPVTARPPSQLYRLQKLVKRNKAVFATGAGISLALVGALAVTISMLAKEREAHQRAVAAEKSHEHLLAETELRKLTMERSDFDAKGDLAAVEAADRKILVLQTNLYGSYSSNMVLVLQNLGWALFRERKYSETEAIARNAIAMHKKISSENTFDLADAFHQLGDALEFQKRFAEAEPFDREALSIEQKLLGNENEYVFWSAFSLSRVLRGQGKLNELESAERENLPIYLAAAGQKNNGYAQRELARMYFVGEGIPKDPVEGLKWLRKRSEGGDKYALNDLAWSLATSPNAHFRDGSNAVFLAEKAVETTKRKDATTVDTLAAAYAEIGQFEKAVTTQKEAISLASDKQKERDGYTVRLKLYESNSPYHQPDHP